MTHKQIFQRPAKVHFVPCPALESRFIQHFIGLYLKGEATCGVESKSTFHQALMMFKQ